MNKVFSFLAITIIFCGSFSVYFNNLKTKEVDEKINAVKIEFEKNRKDDAKRIIDEVVSISNGFKELEKKENFFREVKLTGDEKKYVNSILTTKRLKYIMSISNDKLTSNEKKLYIKYIIRYSKKYNISPILIASQIHRESNFRSKLVSSKNAKGCMQVIYKYHKEDLHKQGIEEKDLTTIKGGVEAGCIVLAKYIAMNDGDIHSALMWYVGYGGNRLDYAEDIFRMSKKAYEINI